MPRDRYGSYRRSPRQMELSWWKKWRIASALAQTISANARVSKNADGGATQNEPEIAVDWATPGSNRVVAGAIDYSFDGFASLGAYISDDGGTSWGATPQEVPGLTSFDRAGDPSVDFDTQGNAFLAGVAFDAGSMTCADRDNAIILARLSSGSTSWNSAVVVHSTPAGTGRELDKPWVAVDRSPESPYRNNVYVAWNRVAGPSCTTSYIMLARSRDGGNTFDSTVIPSDTAGGADTWVNVAVDAAGDVNLVWVDQNDVIKFDKCTNEGTMCGTDRTVYPINRPPSILPNTGIPMSWIPAMAINVRTVGTQQYGYIYVVWNQWIAGQNQSDIYFMRSIDGGQHFSPTSPTPQPIPTTPQDEIFPTIAISVASFVQVVQVMYYRRTSQTENTFNTYMISSGDAGVHWSAPVQLNDDVNISPIGGGIGDYIGIDTGRSEPNPRTNTVWMDSRRGQQDVYSTVVTGC